LDSDSLGSESWIQYSEIVHTSIQCIMTLCVVLYFQSNHTQVSFWTFASFQSNFNVAILGLIF